MLKRTAPFSFAMPKRKLLLTPGPLLTSQSVRDAANIDVGSRDSFFVDTVQLVRDKLLEIANVTRDDFCSIIMQGSGTFACEAAFSTSIPRGDNARVLVLNNGAYGTRHFNICNRVCGSFSSSSSSNSSQISTFDWPEGKAVDIEKFAEFLEDDKKKNQGKDLSTFIAVHHETSTGILNDVDTMCKLVKSFHPGATTIIDSMSGFGGVSMSLRDMPSIDLLVSSMNKNLQGIPGAAILLVKKQLMEQLQKNNPARSLVLDYVMQYNTLEKTGQFPFTPPTHALLAFRRALEELEEEGGVPARYQRYKGNNEYVYTEMTKLGFTPFIKDDISCPHFGKFITSYDSPTHVKNWSFKQFYDDLAERDLVLYPGKASKADTFRIGNIGDLHRPDFELLIKNVKEVLELRNVQLK